MSKELIKAQDEYIKFLGEQLDKMCVIAYTHGILTSDEDIAKGEQMRNQIKKLKDG